MTGHRTHPALAFAAGAVVMLLLALAWCAWQGRDDAAKLAHAAASATRALPDFRTPDLPEAPRLPKAPLPVPK
jgi:hypothetical protein